MKLSRRYALRGSGIALALPWLEAMSETSAHAARRHATPPMRTAVFYVPNGVHIDRFFPKQSGPGFDLPPTLEPLAPHQNDLMVLSGLSQYEANPGPDGGGDHARAMATFLTGTRAKETDGAGIRVGVSFDQVAAKAIGHKTRLPSLELSCAAGNRAGACDTGYACTYIYHLSWRTPTLPLELETDPAMAFDRVLGIDRRTARDRRSVLDLVYDDGKSLARSLGGRDRNKLDEYMTATRELEQRLDRFGGAHAERPRGAERPPQPPPNTTEHIRTMCDVITLAFQVDATRVITFAVAPEASDRTIPEIGVHEGHHFLSHHQQDERKLEIIARIDLYYMRHFAYLLDKLKTTTDGSAATGERPLLDSTMLLYGSGISDGDRHNHDELPVILAGRANGKLSPGRHVRYPQGTPLNNLYLSLLDRIGTPVERLGDSTGRLDQLS